ncbi:MAG: hypothetical protein WA821_06260 [Anaerolineales bacterium]
MPLITVFSAPKPFTNPHIAIIQRNAITSWTQLPDVEVILLGDETGLADAARELGVELIGNVPHSPSGAPLMDAMFAMTRRRSAGQLLCIVNADILLLPDFVETARQVAAQREKFVLLGQRWDLDVTTPLDFSQGWADRLRATVQSQGQLHRPAGSDYFLFPLACYTDLPAFTIGRAGWDNWMIYKARKENWPVVDATSAVMIIHQNHDYSHLPGGKPHYDHPETDENIRLAGGRAMTRFTLLDTDYRIENGKILPQIMDRARTWRRIETWPLLALGSTRLSNLLWRLRRLARKRKL